MKGFALLEVMISLVLSLIIVFGIYEVYQSIENTYRYLQALVYLQENGQMASYLLRSELSMTGYVGCRKIEDVFLRDNTKLIAIQAYDAHSVASLSHAVAKQIVPTTDAVLVRYLSSHHATLLNAITTPTTQIHISDAPTLKDKQSLIIADCHHADRITLVGSNNYNGQWLQIDPAITQYDEGSYVGELISSLFYIGNTGRVNSAGDPISALYVHHMQDRDEELIENVDRMQVQYGVNSNAGELQFYSEHAISDWEKVQAIYIHLLLDSGEPALSKPQHLSWKGNNEEAPDRRLYKNWNVIVGLPNR